MSERDYISDLFQRNQHKLDEKPPSDLWGRLEDRLDKRKKPGFGYVKYFAAASVFLALSCSLVIFYQIKNNNPVVGEQSNPVAQTLIVTEDGNGVPQLPPPPKANETEKQSAPIAMDVKVDEPNHAAFSFGDATHGEAPAEVAAAPIVFEPFKEVADEIAAPKEVLAGNVVVENKNEPSARMNNSFDASESLGYEYPSMTNAQAPGRLEDGSKARPELANKPALKDVAQVGEADDEDVSLGKSEKAKKKERYKASGARKRSVPQDEITDNVKRFMWLLGTWKDGNFEGESYETWELKDGNTLEGRGYLVVDGDTLLTERLTLQQEGDNFYYVAAVDNFNRRVKFKLVSINGDRSTFEQYSEGFPSQIVLERKPDGGYIFEMESQNGGYTNDQTTYLSKRNFVAKEKSVRRMSKKG